MASLDETDKRYFLMVTPAQDIGNIGPADIAKSCDICNEGKSKGRKFRLHLYIKDTYENASIACFNCNYSANMYSYLRDNHPTEYEMYKREKSGQSFKELKMVDTSKPIIIDKSLLNINKEPKPILIEPVSGFTPLENETEAVEHLKNRGIEPQEDWMYSPKGNKIMFNETEQFLSDFIIIPLTIGRKWYGFQALAYKQKKFFVYMVNGNTGWKIWNWNKIDKEKPVYIFESIYDAISSGLENSVAQLGSNISEERLKQLKEPIFCLDNFRVDDKAKEEAQKYLKRGFKAFIWPKGSEKFKDTNDLRKIGVPFNKIADMIKGNIKSGMVGEMEVKLC